MIASILLFVTVAILNYTAKPYLRQAISRKYSPSWQNEICRKTYFMQKRVINNFF